jgi:hypothetical protein
MDALNDLLRGGFDVHDYKEPIELIWKESSASEIALGELMFLDIIGLIHKHIELVMVRPKVYGCLPYQEYLLSIREFDFAILHV